VRAAITGARGFVGRHLAAHLTRRGTDVVELDLDGERRLDVTDHDAVVQRIADERPDVVYHLAARSHVGASWDDGEQLKRVNVDGTRAVLDACVRAGVERVLVVGSAEQYGPVGRDELPVGEAAPCRPITPYGESKVEAEAVALEVHREHGLAVICTRAFNHTGPGQPPTFLVPGLAARVVTAEREGHDEIVLGNGDPVRDFSDVRDVVRAYVLLVERGTPGEAYNVCSGRGVRVDDLAAELVGRSTRALRITTSADLVRPVDIPALVGDPAKLVAATGWEPEIELSRTLDDVLAAARTGSR
jgi:GDP-4-dehydro-6-deoxy-D-mannose reductase